MSKASDYEESKAKTTLVFVYGSLKNGFALHNFLDGQQFIGLAQSRPLYRLFDCGEYPALVQEDTAGRQISGEVYAVDEQCLSRLDEVEAVDEGLYERRQIALAAPYADQLVEAYFYLKSITGLRDCGTEWRAHQR